MFPTRWCFIPKVFNCVWVEASLNYVLFAQVLSVLRKCHLIQMQTFPHFSCSITSTSKVPYRVHFIQAHGASKKRTRKCQIWVWVNWLRPYHDGSHLLSLYMKRLTDTARIKYPPDNSHTCIHACALTCSTDHSQNPTGSQTPLISCLHHCCRSVDSFKMNMYSKFLILYDRVHSQVDVCI